LIVRKVFNKLRSVFFGKQLLFNQVSRKLAKGAAGCSARIIDSQNPLSWEFSAFSQNGEDGIIDYLTKRIKTPNKYFIEIGSADGIENNSAWLATCRQFSGLMIEGNTKLLSSAKKIRHNLGVEYLDWFVTQENIDKLNEYALYTNPDFFSLDIDGNDYFLLTTIIEGGFRPKVITVEYNSAYGPDNKLTIEYDPKFVHNTSNLESYPYYGVSLAGWKTYMSSIGYEFVTVESNGVNAFFIDPDCFDKEFINQLEGVHFIENFYQYKKYRKDWSKQFAYIHSRKFHIIK